MENAIELNWNFIREQLPAGWRELTVEMGLIHPVPRQLNAKIHDIEPILRLELYRAGLEASLQTTTATAAAAKVAVESKGDGNAEANSPLVDLSAPSLHEWERKLGPLPEGAGRAVGQHQRRVLDGAVVRLRDRLGGWDDRDAAGGAKG